MERLISIHSPHVRGDKGVDYDSLLDSISIHSPHVRGDQGLSV